MYSRFLFAAARLALVSALVLIFAPARAHAQAAFPMDASGAYSVLYDQDLATAFKRGWVAAFAARVTDWVSVAAEGGGSYHRIDVSALELPRSVFVHNIMGGPRVVAHRRAVSLFGQVLAGLARTTRTNPASGRSGVDGASEAFAVQPGVGVDLNFTTNGALRVQADYRVISGSGPAGNQARFLTGFVIRFQP
jgi:hypothetical protein